MPIEALRSCTVHFDEILRAVKPKRLAAELFQADKAFHFKYFKGFRRDKIGRGHIKKIAEREIFKGEGHELFANLLIVHWNEANGAIYQEMVAHVKTINEDVEAIEQIEDDKANAIIDDLLKRHPVSRIYVCVRLNGVRFREELIQSRLVRGEPAGALAEAEAEAEAESEPGDAEPAPEDTDAPETADASEAADASEEAVSS